MIADFCIYLKRLRSSFSSGTRFMLSGEKFQPQWLCFLICKKCSRPFPRTCVGELMKQKLETTAATSVLRGDLWPPLQCDLVFLATKLKQNFFFVLFFFFFKSFFNVNFLQTEKSCLSSFVHESFLRFSFILWWQRSASVWSPSCWCQPRDTCSPRLSRFCMIQEPEKKKIVRHKQKTA